VTAQVENWTCDVRPGVELTTEITAELEQTAKCPERAGAALLDFSHSGPVAGPAVVGAISIPVIGGLGGGLMARWADANGARAIGYAAIALDSQTEAYANVARTTLDAITVYAEDVRAGRQLRAVTSQRNSFVGFGLLEVTVAPEMQRSQD
jgi:3-methyl-2-oxobutanoate hydroxymethyltransferase